MPPTGRQLAVIGFGTTVQAYQASTGTPLWVSSVAGFGAGAQIVSVRSWPKVITAGVTMTGRAPGSASTRREVVLSAASGRLIRSYPAAGYGGAVSADAARTVIVGGTAVTCYSNRTGAVIWSRPTGAARHRPGRPTATSCTSRWRPGATWVVRRYGRCAR